MSKPRTAHADEILASCAAIWLGNFLGVAMRTSGAIFAAMV
ncbi:hypothetical protein U8326_11265 [Tsuneonella sp. CC-YZS046]|nr:hypothetical protein [Tsuneonella sp. CC-YZS046]WRO65628.1 hypothetical protein U8326_11265 [Tsuneonella sp. CC-YZS046]